MKKTNGFLILLALVAVILLGFIAGKAAEPTQVTPTYTPWPTYTPYPTMTPILQPMSTAVSILRAPLNQIVLNYPRVDGSTSAKPLQDVIICRFFLLQCRWEWSVRGGTRYIEFINYYSEESYAVVPKNLLPNTTHNGTHEAYVNLINQETDFILVARLPSADELANAKASGVNLDARPVALDAFVILAHADNPIDTISIKQIRDIYSGQITNWSQVGGLDQPIHAYQREENSGSQELLKSLVMGNAPVINAPDMVVLKMTGPFNAIAGYPRFIPEPGDPNGIGYSVYYYARFIMEPLEDLKILAVEGVRPTFRTIADRSYPLVAEVYAVIRAGESPTATSVLLRDWLLTQDGQDAVAESGYVPIMSLP